MAEHRAAKPVLQRLPGVGDRLDVADRDGHPVSVVRLRSGDVTVHHGDDPPVELDAATAAAVGALMIGRYALAPELAARLADVGVDLELDWVRLGPSDHAVGRTIEQLAVRRRTGVTIVAVLRGPGAIVGPDPDLRLEAADDLVIIGRDDDRERFTTYMAAGTLGER